MTFKYATFSLVLSICMLRLSTNAQAQDAPYQESQAGVPLRSAEAAEIVAPTPAPKPSGQDFLSSIWPMIKLSTQWFLHYRLLQEATNEGESRKPTANRFDVSRGYLTVNFTPVGWFESRMTLDTFQDETGSWKMRLKYLYGKFRVPVETAVVTEPFMEVGIVHTPWLDYEEHINFYRLQGTMLIERNGIQNSADLGITAGVLLGRKLDCDYQKNVSKYYPGTWGSLAFGIYNGGGYHAPENNQNKVFEGRLSVRPLGFIYPNWQVSYFGIYGKGNTANEPEWTVHVFLTSYEQRYFVLTGQYAFGRGNQKGDKFIDIDGDGEFDPSIDHASSFHGASGFSEIRLPMIHSSLIGRFDYWKWEGKEPTYRFIGGYAIHILEERKNVVMIDYDRVMQQGRTDAWELKLTLQVMF